MTNTFSVEGNDLILRRRIAAPPQAIWHALTDAETLKRWFVPRPWRVTEAVI